MGPCARAARTSRWGYLPWPASIVSSHCQSALGWLCVGLCGFADCPFSDAAVNVDAYVPSGCAGICRSKCCMSRRICQAQF